MNKRVLSLLAVLTLLLLAACNGTSGSTEDTSITVDVVSIAPDPLIVGPGEVVLNVRRNNAALAGATVVVTGDMTHAGMAPVEASGLTGDDGLARVPIEWTMGGDWVVRLRVTAPDGAVRTGQFNLEIDSLPTATP